MNGLKMLRKRGLALAVAFLMCLSLLPIQARAADEAVTLSFESGNKYTWKQTIVYHANYPDGTDQTYTVDYTIYSLSTVFNGALKTYADCKFTVPDGYDLVERYWNTESDGTGTAYISKNDSNNYLYKRSAENTTTHLYATYKCTASPVVTYTLTYMDGAAVYKTVSVDKDTAATVEGCTNTKDGYTFKGWDTSQAAAKVVYAPGEQITITSNTTLYAVWEDIPPVTYTVSFNANGGSGSMKSVAGISGVYTLPDCDFTAPSGKRFKGWATSSGGAVISGKTITVSGNMTLYAVWEDIPTDNTSESQGSGSVSWNQTIVYHANYPDGSDKTFTVVYAISSNTQVYNGTLKAYGDCGFTVPGGYSVASRCWNTSADGTGTSYTSNAFLFERGKQGTPTNLYATYTETAKPSYTVTFNANGGSGSMKSMAGISGAYTLPDCDFTAPSGKQFKGWSTSSGGAVISGKTITVSGNMTLYAVWEDIPPVTYTVSFNANGGSGSMKSVAGISGVYTLPDCDFTAPSGKRFKGWSTSSGGAVIFGKTITVSGNMTLYAVWEDVKPGSISETQGSGSYCMNCTIVYHANYPGGADDTKTYNYTIYSTYNIANTGINVNLKSFSDLGFEADGYKSSTYPWNSAASGSGKRSKGILYCSNGSTVHLYAQWEAIPVPVVYTVVFNSQGGSAVKSAAVSGSGKVAKPAAPTRSGYTFGGWYKESACTNAWNFDTDTVTGDITLYAKWTANSSKGNSGGGSGSGSQTATTKNSDGSITTTTTNSLTGTVTKTTTNPDNSITTVVTERDGTVTATQKTADGVSAITVTSANGTVSSVKAYVPSGAAGAGAVTLPLTLPSDTVVDITVIGGGSATVKIPAESVTSGTVAVVTYPDGTEKVVRKSAVTGDSVALAVEGSMAVKLVDNSKAFADVPVTSWAADAVAFATARELLNGTSVNTFSPDMPMTRGALAQVLHNLEGNPPQAYDGTFTDVSGGAWYAEAVEWAAAQGIADGYGNGAFGAEDSITREQLAVMLWRYSGSPAATSKELHFSDADEISGYALEALRWAVENGIINGYGSGRLGPKEQATHAQAAQALKNFLEEK